MPGNSRSDTVVQVRPVAESLMCQRCSHLNRWFKGEGCDGTGGETRPEFTK